MAHDINKIKEHFKKYAERKGKESGYSVKVTTSTVKSTPPKYRITFELVETDYQDPKKQKKEKERLTTPVRDRRRHRSHTSSRRRVR